MRGWWALAGAAAAAAVAYATRVEPYWLRVHQWQVPLPGLPDGLDGLTILHLSDLHFRPGDGRRHALVRRAASLGADLVCMTGDYGDLAAHGPAAVALLGDARGKLGTFAVMGNHDADVEPTQHPHRFSRDVAERTAAALEAAGVTVLANENVRLDLGGQRLSIVGLDDPHTLLDDQPAAFRGLDQTQPAVVLAHSWEPALTLPPGGARILLAGHAHGGQVRLPFFDAPHTNTLRRPGRASGLFWVDQVAVHLSPGLGGSHSLRFLVRPGAARLTLRAG